MVTAYMLLKTTYIKTTYMLCESNGGFWKLHICSIYNIYDM